ncbi:MAG TPA: outer membrane protein [Pseudolabrys sp.]|nr:outer membrane protein [Pseudolabrys sp.]
MKQQFLAGVSLGTIAALAGGVAQAADLGARPVYKAAPAMVPAFTWTGFYVGGNIGFASTRSSVANDPSSPIAWLNGPISANGTKFIGGLQAGYNWQIQNFVLGLEGDISFGSGTRSGTGTSLGGTDIFSSRLSWLSTIRGRLGVAFDRLLVYGTGGVAFAKFNDTLTDTFPFTATPSSNQTGWAAGAGLEYAFTEHWTVRGEYLHAGFRSRTALDSAGNGYVFAFKDSVDIGRVGINYKF